MTVAELITQLQGFNPEKQVEVESIDGGMPIEGLIETSLKILLEPSSYLRRAEH